MTRDEFIQKYTHEVSGSVMDALFRDAKGGELALLIRHMMQRIDRALGAAYDELMRARAATAETDAKARNLSLRRQA